MELFATSVMNNSIARRIDVYATPSGSFIRKEMPSGRVLEWPSELSAEAWVNGMNNGHKRKADWVRPDGSVMPRIKY